METELGHGFGEHPAPGPVVQNFGIFMSRQKVGHHPANRFWSYREVIGIDQYVVVIVDEPREVRGRPIIEERGEQKTTVLATMPGDMDSGRTEHVGTDALLEIHDIEKRRRPPADFAGKFRGLGVFTRQAGNRRQLGLEFPVHTSKAPPNWPGVTSQNYQSRIIIEPALGGRRVLAADAAAIATLLERLTIRIGQLYCQRTFFRASL